jgi:DGQHR domain-containing protein
MEITLKGRIKNLVKDFGFIYCETNNTDYFFHESSIESNSGDIAIGSLVSFVLRANRGREGSHAIQVRVLKNVNTNVPSLIPTIKNRFSFESRTDMLLGLKHIKEKLEYQKYRSAKKYTEVDIIVDEIDDLLYIISDILEGPQPNWEQINVTAFNNSISSSKLLPRQHADYWSKSFSLKEFAHNVESISSRETDRGSSEDFSIVWHEWKEKEKQFFHAGYLKGHFNYSFIEKGAKEQTSVYDSAPPDAKWKLNKIVQKGHVFYITSAPVNEVAQSSSVPALPPKLGIMETAERILDKNRNNKEWQREIDSTRIRKIRQFISESNNIVANTPMLFIHDENSVTIQGDTLTINFSKFLRKQSSGEFSGKLVDRIKRADKDEFGNDVYDDFRPFWIIDGQHRVRGINLNDIEQNLQIPLIVFPKNFTMSNTAKVFAEINTLQKKLNPLHELFMQHRFSIDHPTNIKRKFKDYSKVNIEDAVAQGWDIDDWKASRANHLAYEILAKLAKNGPLKNRVQFLPQNDDNNLIYISADQWVNYARTLFERKCYSYKNGDVEDYVITPNAKEKKVQLIDLFYEEMNNYFYAWVETCNHNEWPDRKPRWVEQARGKALIQRKTHFIILIELYALVRDYAMIFKRKESLSGIIKITEFKEILKPFKWVDWQHKDIENTFPGSGEKGRRSLEVWMADAIINGVQYSYDEIMDSSIKSKPGRGINAVLHAPTLEITSSVNWPTKNNPVTFKSTRPWNARYEATWKVEDENEDIKAEGKSLTSKHLGPMPVEFILKHEKYMDDANNNELTIRIDWKNSHTHTGKKTIKISKPKISS